VISAPNVLFLDSKGAKGAPDPFSDLPLKPNHLNAGFLVSAVWVCNTFNKHQNFKELY
jgi:hypothetical protein